MEEKWIDLCKDVYKKKEFLNRGLYSPLTEPFTERKEKYTDFGFVFPLPMEAGVDLIDIERDFTLPYDLLEYLDAIGGEEWLEKRGSDTIPSKFTYIRRSNTLFI